MGQVPCSKPFVRTRGLKIMFVLGTRHFTVLAYGFISNILTLYFFLVESGSFEVFSSY